MMKNSVISYAVTIAIVAIAIALRWLMDPWLENELPLTMGLAAVIACVWYGGWRCGLLATVLSYLMLDYLFVEPRGSFGPYNHAAALRLFSFTLLSVFIMVFGETMRRSQAQLREGRRILQITFASIGDAIITTDTDGRITFLNAVAEKLTGWNLGAVKGLSLETVFRIINEDSRQTVETPVRKALREGAIIGLANHTILITKDGKEVPIDDSASPIYDETGNLHGSVLIFRDITEKREADRTQARLAAIINSSDDAIISKTLDGIIISWNKGAEHLFGYTANEVIGQSIELIIPLDRRDEEKEILAKLRRGERLEHFPTVRVTKNGTAIDISLSVSPIIDKYGKVVGASKIARDISAQKREEALLARLAAIVGSSDDAIISKTLDGKIVSWNKGAERIFGYTAEQAIGQLIDLIIPPERRGEERAILDKLRDGESIEHFETVRVAKDGGHIDVSLTTSPIRDNTGKIIGASKVTRDITNRKLNEESLRQTERYKDELIATLAHELRNPLAPVRNSLELIKRAPDDSSLIELARDVMDRQIKHMERLIDDLLDFSRITRNQLDLKLQSVDLLATVQQVINSYKPIAEQSGHELTVHLPDKSVFLNADPVRLDQIMGNLLSNACKYTPPKGRISLTVKTGVKEVIISVKDTGIGFSADMKPFLFNMYDQQSRMFARQQSGLGIGLRLVRQLVEMHGGRVEAMSEGTGKGSEFIVHLPVVDQKELIPVLPTDDEYTQEVEFVKRRVLVVDDNRDNAHSLVDLIKIMGHEAQAVYSGLQAISAVNRFQPAFIFLDIGMPDMNGYETCKRIREEFPDMNIEIYALTGWGKAEDKARSMHASFDGHIVKPISYEKLAEILTSTETRSET